MANSVYLAGPISGGTYEGTTEWRTYAAQQLAPIRCLDPMRGKTELRGEVAIRDHYQRPLTAIQGILGRDRYDVMRCDVILANLCDAQRVSIGTVMEIAWADLLRKPIVVVMAEGNPHWHGMIRGVATAVVSTLDEALAAVRDIIGEESE